MSLALHLSVFQFNIRFSSRFPFEYRVVHLRGTFRDLSQYRKNSPGNCQTSGYYKSDFVFIMLRDMQLGRCEVDTTAEIFRLTCFTFFIVEIVHVHTLVQVFNRSVVVHFEFRVGGEQRKEG